MTIFQVKIKINMIKLLQFATIQAMKHMFG